MKMKLPQESQIEQIAEELKNESNTKEILDSDQSPHNNSFAKIVL